jgi:hypothetical protein
LRFSDISKEHSASSFFRDKDEGIVSH